VAALDSQSKKKQTEQQTTGDATIGACISCVLLHI